MVPGASRGALSEVRSSPEQVRSGSIRVRWAPIADPAQRAFAIGRHLGSAVSRNRLRRRLDHALAEIDRDQTLPRAVLLIIPAPSATQATYRQLASALGRCVEGIRDVRTD